MPMTAAERQRLYRQRLKELNPEKFDEIRLKNLNRIKNKYVPVSKLTENQKSIRRRSWRKLKKNQEKKHDSQIKNKNSSKEYQRYYKRLKKENEKQKNIINKQRKQIQALKKKIYRQKILLNCQMTTSEQGNLAIHDEPQTPNTKSEAVVKSMNTPSDQDKMKIKKVLLENFILTEAIKQEYVNNKKAKKVLRNIFISSVVRKYRIQSRLRRVIGLKSRIRNHAQLGFRRNSELAKKIHHFYLRDDVSRATAGKKETKTYKKQKHQKRYLLDSLTNLRKKFKEDTGINASIATFRRHRPFYVVKPQLSNRETCVCKIHANIEFKFMALKKLMIFDSGMKLINILEEIVCDTKSKDCMYSECHICKTTSPTYNFTKAKKHDNVTWLQWTTKDVEFEKNDETKKTKKVVTESKTGKLESLISLFEQELKKFKVHYFNIWHQHKVYRNLKSSLLHDEVIIHCDFSENYNCKMHRQIQSAHFGNQNQISLHTSVIYIKGSKPQAYCTLSDSTDHSPPAIWAHLRPILTDIKRKFPQINIVHVFSDGPATQYKQKKNFYLYKLYLEDLDFEKGTWNFSESYHGKGAADGVGGVIKRLLDARVSHGMDVLDTSAAYSLLKEDTAVNIFCVDESDISEIKSKNQTALEVLVPVPKTMKVHQIQVETEHNCNEINYRVLSCFCNKSRIRGFCDCFDIKRHCLLKPRPRKRTRLTSDSDDCLSSLFKKQVYNINTLTNISNSENKTTPDSLKNSPIVQEDTFGTGNDDLDSLDIFDLSRTVDTTESSKDNVKSSLKQIKTPVDANHTYSTVTNKENVDHRNKLNFKKINKNVAPVTILSDVRVNYSLSDLKKMISDTKRQNVSSCNLKEDFPEILDSSSSNFVSLKKKSFFSSSSESE